MPNIVDRLQPFGLGFDKGLEVLIRGIRTRSNDQEKLAAYLEDTISQCKQQLKNADIETKSMIVLKLAYLEMFGYDMSWCSFQILDVLSSPKFQHKRIGYLAAIQILQRQDSEDALMLMTNQLKKDLNSSNYVECGLAIACIASCVTSELAHDICDDLVKMLNHSKPYIRKRAVLAMYKVFLKYPESLPMYFNEVMKRLDDSDTSVVSATVNVICELAHSNPSNYVELAPRLFGLLKETSNNWMVIRLLKLFSYLSVAEPRLKKKLMPEIVHLMENTDALSLVYECINAILNGEMLTEDDVETAELIIEKLLSFFKSDDQNLKYVCLLAFIKTCKIHKKLIKKHTGVLLSCLYENDITIRETALEIVDYLVSERNIVTVVARLLVQLVPYDDQKERLHILNQSLATEPDDDEEEDNSFGTDQQPLAVSDKYRLRVIEKIVEICSLNSYENIPNFHWYIGVLLDILKINSASEIAGVDELITDQFTDMSIRIPSIRSFLVESCLELCLGEERTTSQLLQFGNGLRNCIWVVGEYYDEYLEDTNDDEEDDPDNSSVNSSKPKITVPEIIDHLSHQEVLQDLDAEGGASMIIPVYIEAAAKLFSKYTMALQNFWNKDDLSSVKELCKLLIDWLSRFTTSTNFESQERSVSFIEILKLVSESLTEAEKGFSDSETVEAPKLISSGYSQMFNIAEIRPISYGLQQRIPVPDDLDLSGAINSKAMGSIVEEIDRLHLQDIEVEKQKNKEQAMEEAIKEEDEDSKTISKDIRKKERIEKQEEDPYYITGGEKKGEDTNATVKHHKPRKKIKKEKVLILDEEGGNDKTDEKLKKKKPRKSIIDTSNLEKVDLHSNGVEQSTETEYKTEQEVEQMRKQLEAVPIEDTTKEVKVVRKNPKRRKKHHRKVRRSAPVIHEDK